jgi:hypothetical protein
MKGGRTPAAIFVVVSVVTMVVAIVGFVVTIVLNSFFLDDVDKYGEVPIPGSNTLHLPAGEVTISFRTQLIGSTGGSGLPVPQLSMNIKAPAGVADPVVTEAFGGTTTVNGDARRRVWVAQIAQEGNYTITADGQVSAFLGPRLAFGQSNSQNSLPWVVGGLFAVSLVGLAVALWWLGRVRRRPRPAAAAYQPFDLTFPASGPRPPADSDSYTPTDDGIRIQQLKTLAALRDSGALTEQEFQAEKRKLLEDQP